MTPIKRKLLYIFRATLLRLRISWDNGKTITLSIGYHVDKIDSKGKQKWDGTRCKSNSFHGPDKIPASIINKELEDIEERINNAFYKFEASNCIPSKEQLKLEIKPNKYPKNIWPDYIKFIEEGTQLHQWSDNTVKSIRQIANLVKKYDQNPKYEDLNKEWFNKFIIYQQNNKLSEKNFSNKATGYSNIVIEKNMRIFRWFLKWAVRKGHVPNSVIDDSRSCLKSINKQVIFLDWDELMRFYNFKFDNGSTFDIVRDFFCLCCFTSLRYSDAYSLRKSQIENNCINITTQKTSDTIIIDLNKYSKAILEKYKDISGDFALPRVKLPLLNKCLKRMGKLLGIDSPVHISQYYGSERIERSVPKYELISSHCGRRTFICNALAMGITPTVVMEWTGHSEYSSMKPYIAVANKIREESMSKFDTYGSKQIEDSSK